MKHAWTKILLAVAAAFTFGLALAGCSRGEEKKYDYLVTFNYNAVGIAEVPEQYLGVKSNSLIIAPTSDNTDFKLQAIKGYTVEGWFLPVLNEDGTPKKDEDGRIVLDMSKEWNFRTGRVEQETVLYANLSRKSRIDVAGVEMDDYGKVKLNEDGTAVRLEDLTFTPNIVGTPGTKVVKGADARKRDYTLIGYYTDENLTQEFDWDHTFGEEDEVIYAGFLSGTWKTASTAAEFNSAIASRSNIYVKNDIDYSDGTEWTQNLDYASRIIGNGYKIKNVTCVWESAKNQATYGLFRSLGDKFSVCDLSFENVDITFRALVPHDPQPGYYKISAFAVSVSEEATFENFAFGGSLTVERSEAAQNSNIYSYAISETPPAAIVSLFTVAVSGD